LRPSNILWFSNGDQLDQSELVITDFGSAVIDHGSRTEEWSKQQLIAVSRTYRSPECDEQAVRISSAMDIWALGCTFLEFITWFLLGWDGVQKKFYEARLDHESDHVLSDAFFCTSHGHVEVKPQIRRWIHKLAAHRSCSQYLGDFLRLILNQMLEVDPIQRVKAMIISVKLRDMYSRCCADPSYYEAKPA